MVVSEKLRERFCKDCNLPIKIFVEPYFTSRIELYDKYYNSVDCWNRFLESVINNDEFQSEQDYFEHYNEVKDNAIDFIKSTEAYQKFNETDMNKFSIVYQYRNLPKNDIFKPMFHSKSFISIDMKKANFSSLHHFDKSIFDNTDTWEEFIEKFTSNEHIINSKYIRQAILGNCNPKRHITYEKHLMGSVLYIIDSCMAILDKVVFFSNDEVVLDVTYDVHVSSELGSIRSLLDQFDIPFTVEYFTLYKIEDTQGYKKLIHGEQGDIVEFKCLDSFDLPFVIRKINGEEIQDKDKVFVHQGRLAKFID